MVWARTFNTVSRPTVVQLMVIFCSSILVVLYDTQGIKCHNTLFLLSPYFGFLCDLFSARYDSQMN